MAQISASLSLIGFGFAIFKFLQVMQHGFIMDEGISCSTFANVAREANKVQIEPTDCPPYFAEPAAYSDCNFKLDRRDVV